jgi:hypothetical protein
MLNALLLVLAALATGLFLALLYGIYRWNVRIRRLGVRLGAAQVPIRPKMVDFAELESLPPVVQRYLQLALTEGQPMVAGVRVRHKGTLIEAHHLSCIVNVTYCEVIPKYRPASAVCINKKPHVLCASR